MEIKSTSFLHPFKTKGQRENLLPQSRKQRMYQHKQTFGKNMDKIVCISTNLTKGIVTNIKAKEGLSARSLIIHSEPLNFQRRCPCLISPLLHNNYRNIKENKIRRKSLSLLLWKKAPIFQSYNIILYFYKNLK